MSLYGPGSEKSDDERELFLEKFNECLGSFRDNLWLVVLGDLNVRVGNDV